jgi:hypothetical protein
MRLNVLATLALSTALPLTAQLLGHPKVDVVVPMPPTLGVHVTELALVPPGNSYSMELHMILIRQFQASKLIRMKEASKLERLPLSGLDEPSKASLKSSLGPVALLSVNVNGVEPVQTLQQGGKTYNGRVYHAVTTVVYHVNVELLDLASGRLTKLPPMNIESSQQREEFNVVPIYPDPDAVRAMATRVAAKKVLSLLLPWADHRELVFFDDASLNMKAIFNLVKEKKLAEALVAGRAILAQLPADAKPREVAHLNYDLGLLQLMSGHYSEAVMLLEAAVAKDQDGDLRLGLDSALEAVKNQESIQKIMAP